MKYTTPDLEGNLIALKGRRFWVIQFRSYDMFRGIDTTQADHAVFDRLNDTPVACVQCLFAGGLEVITVTGRSGPQKFASLKDAVPVVRALQKEELNSTVSSAMVAWLV